MLFDWGVAGPIKGVYDLANVVGLAMLPESRKDAMKPADAYYQELVNAGVRGYSRPDFDRDYAAAMLLVFWRRIIGVASTIVSSESESISELRRVTLQRCAGHVELLELGATLE